MVEVFKTNVECPEKAAALLDRIHAAFDACKANFDLDDNDRILRVKGAVLKEKIVAILAAQGFECEAL